MTYNKFVENFKNRFSSVKLDALWELWNSNISDRNIQNCTCINCENPEDCEWAFDLYNYKGDCLAEK